MRGREIGNCGVKRRQPPPLTRLRTRSETLQQTYAHERAARASAEPAGAWGGSMPGACAGGDDASLVDGLAEACSPASASVGVVTPLLPSYGRADMGGRGGERAGGTVLSGCFFVPKVPTETSMCLHAAAVTAGPAPFGCAQILRKRGFLLYVGANIGRGGRDPASGRRGEAMPQSWHPRAMTPNCRCEFGSASCRAHITLLKVNLVRLRCGKHGHRPFRPSARHGHICDHRV